MAGNFLHGKLADNCVRRTVVCRKIFGSWEWDLRKRSEAALIIQTAWSSRRGNASRNQAIADNVATLHLEDGSFSRNDAFRSP
jgi:hypothetical protein